MILITVRSELMSPGPSAADLNSLSLRTSGHACHIDRAGGVLRLSARTGVTRVSATEERPLLQTFGVLGRPVSSWSAAATPA